MNQPIYVNISNAQEIHKLVADLKTKTKMARAILVHIGELDSREVELIASCKREMKTVTDRMNLVESEMGDFEI